MNTARVAALLRELADELEGAPEAPKSQPRRVRKAPAMTRPDGEAAPIVAAQAARILRDRGFR